MQRIYRITDRLATWGIGENSYPQDYADNRTGESMILFPDDPQAAGFWHVLDVRYMLDEPQDRAVYLAAIHHAGYILLKRERKLVICCGAGQSRSNAIALGYLVGYEGMNFYDAWNLIREKVPICNIEPCHINALKRIFKVTLP